MSKATIGGVPDNIGSKILLLLGDIRDLDAELVRANKERARLSKELHHATEVINGYRHSLAECGEKVANRQDEQTKLAVKGATKSLLITNRALRTRIERLESAIQVIIDVPKSLVDQPNLRQAIREAAQTLGSKQEEN